MYFGMMTNLDYYLSQKPIHPTKMLSSGPINGSFFDVIKGFIHSVNTMETTVLVPTLLKDINLDGVTWVPTLMAKGNYRQLFEIYCLIKKCKSHFTEVDFDEVDSGNTKPSANYFTNNLSTRYNQMKTKELSKTIDNPLLFYAIETGIGYLSSEYVINYCQQQQQQQSPASKVSSPTPSTSTLSSSSTSGSNRKQKISLDSGNWSSRGSDSIDDDFDFDTTINGINGSSTTSSGTPINGVNPINCLIDSDDTNDTNNNIQFQLHHQNQQQQPLTTLLRATSTNLRNLKALFNHLKEVADFVTQQYLQALQLI